MRRGRVDRRKADRSILSCIAIAEERVAPIESARASLQAYDLTDLDDGTSEASAANPSRQGRGSRSRRAANRALRLQ